MITGSGCVHGRIQSVTDNSLTINPENAPRITIERSRLLRVEGYGVGVVYSGRSSWSDVKMVRPTFERMRVISGDGRKHEGAGKASDDEVTIEINRRSESFRKDEIARVYVLADRPASDVLDEMVLETPYIAVFDPELWVYMMQKKMPLAVRLYDSSLPEDNLPLECTQ